MRLDCTLQLLGGYEGVQPRVYGIQERHGDACGCDSPQSPKHSCHCLFGQGHLPASVFSRAVSAKTQPPKDLVAGLATTMKTAREVGLTIPPGLQARVGKYVESKDAKDTKSK